MLDFSTFNLPKCNISCKNNFFECKTKIVLFGYFWTGTRKSYYTVVFLHHTLKFFQTKFCPNIKILKFATKIVLIGYFGQEFQKTKPEFKISILEFVQLQYNKNCNQISNHYTQSCVTIKHHPKQKQINYFIFLIIALQIA